MGGFFAALGNYHRNDLVLELAGVNGGNGLLLGGKGEGVLLFPGDAQSLGDLLRRSAHVIAAKHFLGLRAELTLGDGVHKLGIAGAHAPAAPRT